MNEQELREITETVVAENGLMFVDLAIRGQKTQKVFEIYIDSTTVLTIEECALVSRAINEQIETRYPEFTQYRLDVSSPGVDRPLKFLAQYTKHINRKFEVVYQDGDAQKKLSAKLMGIQDEVLLFQIKDLQIEIPFSSIISAKVVISFS